MSWRSTGEWPDDKLVLPRASSRNPSRRRSARRHDRRVAKVAGCDVWVAVPLPSCRSVCCWLMVLVPAGTFASKPQTDPTLSGAQTESGKGKSGDAKGKSDANTKPDKGQAGADKTPPKGTDPSPKGNGGSKDKGTKGNANKPDKSNKGQDKKAAAAAETTPSSPPRPASRPSPATRPTIRRAPRSS